MKKVLLLLAIIMPIIFISSCSDDSGESIDKGSLIGTWSINQKMGEIEGIRIEFDNSLYFKLTYDKYNGKTGDGRPTYIKITERGTYKLEKGTIILNSTTYSTVYYIKVKSNSETSMKLEVDTGEGKYSATANKL